MVSEFKYLGFVLEELGADGGECFRKVGTGRKVTGEIRSAVNARSLRLYCSRVLHERFLVPVLRNESEIMVWRGKKRSKIRVV